MATMRHNDVIAVPASQTSPTSPANPDDAAPLLDIAFAFRQSKVLLTAVDLGVFAALAQEPLDCETLVARLALHGRGARDFLDALVAMRVLDRDAEGRYSNTATAAAFFVPQQPTYVGDLLRYLDARAYADWQTLGAALRTGEPQRGPFGAGGFEAFYDSPQALDAFMRGMTGGSILTAHALARAFPWSRYRTFVDIGTAQGAVPATIALAHEHLRGVGFDLAQVEPAFCRYIEARGLSTRLSFRAGDFLRDPLPPADVLIMGRILHDWDADTRMLLLRKAHDALAPGGALIVWEAMIDDERRRPAGLLASLNMLIQTEGGSEFTPRECRGWMRACGFDDVAFVALGPLHTAAIAYRC